MERAVKAELLDGLPPTDPGAQGSRRDLQRLNDLMGHAGLAARALSRLHNGETFQLIDLGGGDGTFLLSVARLLGTAWLGRTATLVDRQPSVSPETERAFALLGWRVEAVQSDVLAWIHPPATHPREVMLANLFLHHFPTAELTELLQGLARRARALVALEPRRSARALACSRLVSLLGCNEVTCHDAVASVQAGFAGHELSRLWPGGDWALQERSAGLFSHYFAARRISASP